MHLALADTQSRLADAGNTGPDLTRYLVVCAFLIALVAGLGWLFKRFLGGKLKSRAAQRSLQIMDVLPLGGKQRLAVVRCYDRTFALGLGDKEVSLISELDGVIAPARDTAPTKADAAGFKSMLDEMRRRGDLEPAPKPARERLATKELFG
ncbi:MAG: flagellar biosynthetic protein FliO [Planctomycetes bacterium]|nr:flagellar biosynthetic protein FliO [Planctomycetota bacterium]